MKKNRFTEFRVARKFRSANRAIQILLCLSLLAAVNLISSKHFKRFDLTEAGTYTLAAETKAYLRQLTEPVQIIVTIPEESEYPEIEQIHNDLRKLLRQYEAEGILNGKPMVEVEFVDIYRQRKRAQEIANRYNITQENIILVASGERTREVRLADLYEKEGEEITGFLGENAFTFAILDVTSKKSEKIYFLAGHGEMRLDDVDPLYGLSQLENHLLERNFTLQLLDLAIAGDVPQDADMVIIASPQAALRAEETEILRRYMSERNGRLIALINPGRKHGLDELFYDWGILTDDMAVIDIGKDYRSQGGDLIIRRFGDHPITELLLEYQITALFGLPRPVRMDPAAANDETLQVEALLGTSEQSWAERDYRTQDPVQLDTNRDFAGPISIAAVASRSANTDLGLNIQGGRLIVFGNSDFIANNRFVAFGNQTLFVNSINWALDRRNMLKIPSRPMQSYQIVMSQNELNRLGLYFMALPTIFAAFGLTIFLIRRR